MPKKKLTKAQELQQLEQYVSFLKNAVESENFKANDPERYEKEKAKYDKAKFRLKCLKGTK